MTNPVGRKRGTEGIARRHYASAAHSPYSHSIVPGGLLVTS